MKTKHELYNTWKKMRDRCNNPNAHNYKYYGEKGIKVCKSWNSFEKFIKDVGERPSKNHTLDRINPNGDYKLSNCRWVTKEDQARNKNRVLLFDGQTIPQIAKKIGVDRSTILKAIKTGKTVDDVIKKKIKPDTFLTAMPKAA